MPKPTPLPKVVADGPLLPASADLLAGKVQLVPWDHLAGDPDPTIEGIYTFGHPQLVGAMMDRVPNVKVISNYGVGVDHIHLRDAKQRGIPVGHTPGVLDGATADMGFSLLLAAARNVVRGDRQVRSNDLNASNRPTMLGREVHGAKLGIVGMGRIGFQVARRAIGFDMQVSYFNRNRRSDIESQHNIQYQPLDRLLSTSDFIVLCVPLTPETTHLIGQAELQMMQPTTTLVNIARGAVIDTDALTHALAENRIFAAGLDVTDPEPLPSTHPLLQLDNVVIAPHLGSATVQTRQKMSELSVQNLLAGLQGEPLLHRAV